MVLESLIDVKVGHKQPLTIFILGVIVSFIALFVSYNVFQESTGLFTVVIISLAIVPFLNALIKAEEEEEETIGESQTFFQRYHDIITAYAALFLGMIIAMSLAFVLLPENVAERVFDEQVQEINIIRGKFTFGNQFLDILTNNASVLLLSFLFSFLLGSGAVFILTWNASVLSAAIGILAKSSGGLKAIPAAIIVFLPHGSFEIMAYFIGAIAGGLISAAMTRKKSLKFWFIFKDSMKLLGLSFGLLFIGGIIETMIILM